MSLAWHKSKPPDLQVKVCQLTVHLELSLYGRMKDIKTMRLEVKMPSVVSVRGNGKRLVQIICGVIEAYGPSPQRIRPTLYHFLIAIPYPAPLFW